MDQERRDFLRDSARLGGFGAALPKGRSAAAQAALATLVDEAKQSGVVQKAIAAKDLKGVNVPRNSGTQEGQ